jgi:hypothetical protein
VSSAMGAPSRVHVIANSQSTQALRIADSVDAGLRGHGIENCRQLTLFWPLVETALCCVQPKWEEIRGRQSWE